MKRSNLLLFFLVLSHFLFAQDTVSLKTRLDSLAKEVPGLNEKVDFTLANAPLSELIRAVAETHNLNVNLNNLPPITITNNFTNVLVKDLMEFICIEYDLNIRFTNNIFTFYKEQPVVLKEPLAVYDGESKLISLNVKNDPLGNLAREITKISDYNLMVDQQVENQSVRGFIRELPFDVALQNFADVNNLQLVKKSDKVFVLESSMPPPEGRNNRGGNIRGNRNAGFDITAYKIDGNNFLSITCNKTPINDLLRAVCDQLEVDYMFLNDPQGFMDCRMDSVLFEDFLEVALEASNLSYTTTGTNVYLIGEAQRNGLNESQVYSFKNRTVEGVEEIIPQSLLQNVTIKLFKDMNALIITGNDKATRKVESFLAQIDKAVPNVLIEVIVAEVRKGTALRTGVKAFLSDSVPNTSGQIFGGVDVTVSSESFNKFLNNLDGRGIMNLGRVTPKFYATIQAMEENNNLNVRSTPKLSTLNGHEATLTIGQSVYYLVETQNVTGGVNPIVTVTPRYEMVEANLRLKISPFVSDLGDVTLSIDAEFSDFIPPEIQGAPPGNATRKFISKIRVKNEEMVVMGGLEEVRNSETGSGVPFLSRIPVIKWLFSSKAKEVADSKLLIFIKPTIVY